MGSPGKNTGVHSHSLLQGIFPTQGLNPGLLHCRQILYHLSHQTRQRQWRCQRSPTCTRGRGGRDLWGLLSEMICEGAGLRRGACPPYIPRLPQGPRPRGAPSPRMRAGGRGLGKTSAAGLGRPGVEATVLEVWGAGFKAILEKNGSWPSLVVQC